MRDSVSWIGRRRRGAEELLVLTVIATGSALVGALPRLGIAIAIGLVGVTGISMGPRRVVPAAILLSCFAPLVFHLAAFGQPLVILSGLGVATVVWRIRRRVPPLCLPFPGAWLAWGAAVFIGSLTSSRYLGPIQFLLLFLLPFATGATLGQSAVLRRSIASAFGIGAFAASCAAIYELITGSYLYGRPMDLTGYTRGGLTRAMVSFGHPLSLGMFICLGAFLALTPWRRLSSLRLAIVMTVIAAGVFSTLSRSPVVGLIVGSALFLLAGGGGNLKASRRRTAAIVGAVIVMLLIPGTQADVFRDYLSASIDLRSEEASNIVGREELLKAGADTVIRRPLFGWGFGATQSGKSTIVQLRGETFSDIANFPLSIAIETGLTGLLSFSWIVLSSLRRMFRVPSMYGRAAAAGCVAALVTSLGVTSLFPSGLLFFVLGAFSRSSPMALSASRIGTDHPRPGSSWSAGLRRPTAPLEAEGGACD